MRLRTPSNGIDAAEEEIADAEEEIADAEEEIADAEEEIADAEEAQQQTAAASWRQAQQQQQQLQQQLTEAEQAELRARASSFGMVLDLGGTANTTPNATAFGDHRVAARREPDIHARRDSGPWFGGT